MVEDYGTEGLDVETARRQLDEARSGKVSKYLKLPEGETILRVMPSMRGGPGAIAVVQMHTIQFPGVGLRGYACPRIYENRPCEACAKGQTLQARQNKADQDTGYKLMPKPQAYANVLVRGRGTEAPQVWRFSSGNDKAMHDRIMAMRFGKFGKDFTDPVEGFDFTITRTGTSETNTTYTIGRDPEYTPMAYDTDARGRAVINPARIRELLAQMHDLTAEGIVPNDEELRKLAKGDKVRFGTDREFTSGVKACAELPSGQEARPMRGQPGQPPPERRAPAPTPVREVIAQQPPAFANDDAGGYDNDEDVPF